MVDIDAHEDHVPWIREINFAISRFGHLASEFLRKYGKKSLRAELLISLLEAEKREEYAAHLAESKLRTEGAQDSLAIQIAKNRIRDLRNEGRFNLWVLNEETGEQELTSQPFEETPLYEATVLRDGKPQQLVKWQK